MPASITFFPVGNGDMTLVELDNGQRILIDIHVRAAADDDGDDTPDVVSQLRDRLERDGQKRLYVDAFLLSHPDKDHICGLEKHFHLGKPADWSADDDKILINEMWSSPLIFRRADEAEVADGDPKAWWDEARRRVNRFKDNGLATEEGERILILGEDCDGKTDDLDDILVKVGSTFSAVDRVAGDSVEIDLLGPVTAHDSDEEEEFSKNDSSVVARFALRRGNDAEPIRFLTGGDAGVVVWERLWENYGEADVLEYDLLQAPHHCSWRSLSHDSYSEMGEKATVSADARSALGQALESAQIVASSKSISAEDSDPPSDRARREYVDILGDEKRFICVADYWDKEAEPLTFEVSDADGIILVKGNAAEPVTAASILSGLALSNSEAEARGKAEVAHTQEAGGGNSPWSTLDLD